MTIQTFPLPAARLASLLAATLLAAAPAPAQEPAASRVEEEIEVTEVLIDALVTDRDGQVVLGLGKEDFVVVEGDREVDLTGVTFYSSRRFLEASERASTLGIDAGTRVPRSFIVFLHDQRRGSVRLGSQQLKLGRDLERWVGGLQPDDRVAVVAFDVRLQLHQDFTSDREELLAAVRRAAMGTRTSSEWPSRREQVEGPSLAVGLPSGKALRKKTGSIYSAIQHVAEAAAAIPGRKNLLLLSAGFGDFAFGGAIEPDPRRYPPMVRALNDANVAVYTVDTTPPEFGHPMATSLSRLATDTSGRYFFNFVSFLTPLEQIEEENGGYYLLSYRAEHPAGSKERFQRVKVGTRNPEFRVRARAGYLYGSG